MNILVAIDGSEHAWKALDLAVKLAKGNDALLLVIHVLPYEPLPEGLRAFARAENLSLEEENFRYHYSRTLGDGLTNAAATRAREQGLTEVEAWTVEGRPAEAIISAAEDRGCDMIVMGSRGLSDAAALFLGSVSHRVANQAPCTCVTVK